MKLGHYCPLMRWSYWPSFINLQKQIFNQLSFLSPIANFRQQILEEKLDETKNSSKLIVFYFCISGGSPQAAGSASSTTAAAAAKKAMTILTHVGLSWPSANSECCYPTFAERVRPSLKSYLPLRVLMTLAPTPHRIDEWCQHTVLSS